jgi:hypothetical protein
VKIFQRKTSKTSRFFWTKKNNTKWVEIFHKVDKETHENQWSGEVIYLVYDILVSACVHEKKKTFIFLAKVFTGGGLKLIKKI